MGLRSYFIVSVSLLVPTLTYVFYEADKVGFRKEITASMVLCVFGFLGTVLTIPRMTHLFVKADIFGFDINKRGTPGGEIKIPESLGLISATMYLVCLCFLHLVHEQPVLYTAALSSVTLMTLLGFADDMLDLKWRYKLFLPLIACLPLLVNYTGSTSVMIPRPLRDYVGLNLVNIGYLYHLYMALMSIFCTNAINIYAGLNGLEAGQSFIICCFIMIHNAMQFSPFGDKDNLDSLRANNLLSLDILFPFLGCCLGILYHNWHPSKVFVGDTFCYFAGMTFAMASILGHFSETLLIMFIPQLINFVYSLPQLLGVIHCPRHRLPKYNKDTGKLEGIRSNLNLVNLILIVTGPMTEESLCRLCLAMQVAFCCLGLCMRFAVLKLIT